MIATTPACLLGAGAMTLAAGTSRPRDISLRPLGLALIGAAIALAATPAWADQYRQAADNAQVDCVVSNHELTRISLVGDAFASVSKITTGYPYNDFTVTNEPVRGDIYLSVPEGFAPGRLSFFATSRKGYVYKFACSVGGPEAEQIFVSNPAIAGEKAQAWEAKSSPRDAAVRLVQAMAANSAPDGYTMRQVAAAPTRIGDVTVRLIAEFRGAALTGKVLRIDNRSAKPVTIDPAQLTPAGSLAVSVTDRELAPHGATTLYVVQDGSAGA
ncbi:type-F conjugative transfer system secretin TraK [Sphingomonas sp. MJ1 (PH-R8)]|uniref:type-F conjugative transfer system secretin TraK n=1 Tax=Sphingomonas sp. MJ1 (PH-R8) TaxID=3112950 RepID=UPI003A85DFBB